MSVDTTSINLTSSNYYKDLSAANNAVKFNRAEKESRQANEVAEEKEVVVDTKLAKWEENFKQIQHDPGEGEQLAKIKWGANVDHPDFQSLKDDTKELLKELGTKINDESSAKALSRLLLLMSFKSETDPDALRQVQVEAFKGVADVLGNLKGKINPDFREAILALIDPSTNNEPDKKAERLVDFFDNAGPHELVKRNSKVLNKIQEAFEVSVLQGSEMTKYQDPDGNTIGQQIKDLVKMYVDPILMYPTDPDEEVKLFGEKGSKAIKGVRTDIVNTAMSQAKETNSLMKTFEGITILGKPGEEKKEYKAFSDGETFKEYAQSRLNIVRDYYIDPSVENRTRLIEHYAKFSAERTSVQQKASVVNSSLEMLNWLDRKFNNIIIYPPELMTADEAKESLKTTAQMKVERLEQLKQSKNELGALSKEDLLKGLDAAKKELGDENSIKNLRAAITALKSTYGDKGAFQTAAKDVQQQGSGNNKILSSSDDNAKLDKIFTKAQELKSRDVDKTIEAEEKALKQLLGITNTATSQVNAEPVKAELWSFVDRYKRETEDKLTGAVGFSTTNSVDAAISKLNSEKGSLLSLDSSLKDEIKQAIDDNTNVNLAAFKAAVAASADLSAEIKGKVKGLGEDGSTVKISNTKAKRNGKVNGLGEDGSTGLLTKKSIMDALKPVDGTEFSSAVKKTLSDLVERNKKTSSEANSLDVNTLNTQVNTILGQSAQKLKDQYSGIIDQNTNDTAKIKDEFKKLTNNAALIGELDQSLRTNTTTTENQTNQVDIANSETVKSFVENLDPSKTKELVEASGTNSYKIIKKDDNIAELREKLSTLQRDNNQKLTYLNKVETGLAKMFMDNFTRSGVEGINRAIFGALESSFIKDNYYTGDGVRSLQPYTEKIADAHNATVAALKMNRTYAEAQQTNAYQELITEMKKSAIGAADDVKGQISLVLDQTYSSSQDAFKALVDTVKETHKNTNFDAFKLSPESEKMILNPDYHDPSYKQKQEIEANKLLLSYVDGLYRLPPEKIKILEEGGNTDISDRIKHVKSMAENKDNNISSTNVTVASNKLRELSQQIKRTYESFLNSTSSDKIDSDLGKASGLDSLFKEEKDLADVKVGNKKRLFPAATEFFKNLLASFLTSASGGRRDTTEELVNHMKEKHGEGALAEGLELTGGLVAETFKDVMTDPSAYRRIMSKTKIA